MQQAGRQAYSLSDVKRAVPQLAESHERLGTSLGFFKTQAHQLLSVADYLQSSYNSERPLLKRVLLDESMRLLQQLLHIAAACMQQLAMRLDSFDAAHKDLMVAASLFFCTQVVKHAVLCATQEGQSVGVAGPLLVGAATARNRQVLDMLQSTGDRHACSSRLENAPVPRDLCLQAPLPHSVKHTVQLFTLDSPARHADANDGRMRVDRSAVFFMMAGFQ